MDITTTETLLFTAAAVGFLHTVMGPDHFLPFIAMSRAGGWSLRKTAVVTTACGIGHVLSSVVLGLLGLALGVAVARLVAIEEFRGDVAGWLLLGFGLAYMVWGLHRAAQLAARPRARPIRRHARLSRSRTRSKRSCPGKHHGLGLCIQR